MFYTIYRPDFCELKSYLMKLGATEVVTEEFCSSYQMAPLIEVSMVCVSFGPS